LSIRISSTSSTTSTSSSAIAWLCRLTNSLKHSVALLLCDSVALLLVDSVADLLVNSVALLLIHSLALLLVDSVSDGLALLLVDGVAHFFIGGGALLLSYSFCDRGALLFIACSAFLLISDMAPAVNHSAALLLSVSPAHFLDHVGAHPLGGGGARLLIDNIRHSCTFLFLSFLADLLKHHGALLVVDCVALLVLHYVAHRDVDCAALPFICCLTRLLINSINNLVTLLLRVGVALLGVGGGAPPVLHSLALLLAAHCADIIVHSGTLLVINSLTNIFINCGACRSSSSSITRRSSGGRCSVPRRSWGSVT